MTNRNPQGFTEAFAVKGPDGKFLMHTIRASEMNSWEAFRGPYKIQYWLDLGYTCVPVTVSENARLREQLPEGMKHCTILFKECAKGHGWLTATNWIQHECPTCEQARLREELAEAQREREEARDIHNSNMNRYAERAEQAEARALAALREPSEAMLRAARTAPIPSIMLDSMSATSNLLFITKLNAMLDQFERDQWSTT